MKGDSNADGRSDKKKFCSDGRFGWLQELSNLAHDLKGKHNAEYDHEAFLGKEEAHQFDQLTPEQSKEKLA